VPVQSRDLSQLKDLQDHLDLAIRLPPAEFAGLQALARQLDGRPVIPVVGAGGSYDCGIRLARDIAEDLFAEYSADPAFAPLPDRAAEFERDLGAVADAIGLVRSQKEVVEALGLHESALWPSAPDLTGHFCTYRVLARLAREDLFGEALTFNYDCGFEAALQDEGFLFSPTTLRGRQWHDHATVISDEITNSELQPRGAFVLTKLHGCAARYRVAVATGLHKPEDAIIVKWSQLLDWRKDLWARDVMSDRARRHVLLLLGFSGQDPVIHIGLTRVLADVYKHADKDHPRVVVVGRDPDTLTLRMLVRAGLGNDAAPPDTVTQISTAHASTTAIAVLLLTELLALRLTRVWRGFTLPTSVESRIAWLVVAGPAMLRWSFLLRRPLPWRDYAQRINLELAAERGYVPLMADPEATVRALQARGRIRAELGLAPDETPREALQDDGFIVAPALGRAYLPVGLPADELLQAARSGGELEQARHVLPYPPSLDCVLVGERSGGLAGLSIETGLEVPVP
jgi:hypothetical protein